jgi:hypothetical protein
MHSDYIVSFMLLHSGAVFDMLSPAAARRLPTVQVCSSYRSKISQICKELRAAFTTRRQTPTERTLYPHYDRGMFFKMSGVNFHSESFHGYLG